MVTQFGQNDAINEGSTAQYACSFIDHAGAAIDSGAISTITATLKDANDDTTINSRAGQSVKNVNGGTLDAGGAFSLVLSAADTVARGSKLYQLRRLTLIVVYADGQLTHEVDFFVRSLEDVP